MGKKKTKYNWTMVFLTVFPIIFIFFSVFVIRSDVRLFLISAVAMLAIEAIFINRKKIDKTRSFALALVLLASIGLSAATILTVEKIELIKNPAHVTSCSFSPIVACSPVIASPQASAFDHIPNPIFGIFGFACVLAAGMTILAGASKLSRAWWLTLFFSICFGAGFCIWLLYQGVYNIGALCLYCFSVWLVTFSLFWMTLAEIIGNKTISISKSIDTFLVKNRSLLITITISIIILLLYFRWSDYWNSLL